MAKKKTAKEPKLEFLAFSDAHLHDDIWKNRKEIATDPFVAFDQIVAKAIKLRLNLVAAGDLIDIRRPTSHVIGYLADKMAELEAEGISFYFTQGQHEFADPPWFEVSEWPQHIHKQTIQLGHWTIYGLDYQSPEKLQEELDCIPENVNCLVCHQVWEEFMGNIRVRDGSFVQIPGHIELVITGDLHKHLYGPHYNAVGKEVFVLSPGATHKRTIREPDVHCLTGIYGTTEKVATFPLISRPTIRWEPILEEADLDNFCKNIKGHLVGRRDYCEIESIDKPLVEVPYNAELLNVYRRIKASIGVDGHFFPKELQTAEPELTVEITEQDMLAIEENPLLGALAIAVDSDEEPDVFDALVRLANCSDVPAEIQKLRGECLDDSEPTTS